MNVPRLRILEFTRAIQCPRTKLALAAILRSDPTAALFLDDAQRVTAVRCGREASSDIAYVVGKFESSNPVNAGPRSAFIHPYDRTPTFEPLDKLLRIAILR
jgi:hypothetical protein